MLESIRREVTNTIAAALRAMGIADPTVTIETAPRRELGDLAWAGALPLAKALKRPPRAIAEQVAAFLAARIAAAAPDEPLGFLDPEARVEGPGFLNLRLHRGLFLAAMLEASRRPRHLAGDDRAKMKVIVEHTNINPNKAAHIGHLRNAVLGDTLVRCLRHLGHRVEVQDYIDDTGVQVADVVVGLVFLPEEQLLAATALWPETAGTTDGARARVLRALATRAAAHTLVIDDPEAADFDDLCWELYPCVTRHYEADPTFAPHRTEVLHAIEGGFPADLELDDAVETVIASPTAPSPVAMARLAAAAAAANVRCHLLTMGRLGVAYDVLPHESDIIHRGFWRRAFELLQTAGAIRLEGEGKNAGCWVMSLADSAEFAGMEDADKILVRSNGTVTYTGKDIAYQLWKFGLLRDADGTVHDFGYRPFARFLQDGPAEPVCYGAEGRVLHRTTADPAMRPDCGSFGAGDRVFNVIDVRQSYPQKVVREAIRVLGHIAAADNSIHFAYEMVALTSRAVRQLEETHGISFGLTAEDMAKPFIEMSGRKGIGVKADTLLATLTAEAEKAIASRQSSDRPLSDGELAIRARAIAVGALRYQMARQGRNRVLAFDFADALAFEGDTGPYLQYSAVRAGKIFDKLAIAGLAGDPAGDAAAVVDAVVPDDLWALVFTCGRLGEMTEKAVAALEFSLLASFARDLAQAFHKLYHEYPVLHAPDEQARALRRAVFRVFQGTIATILEELLGIPLPAEM